jgi:hypothetical protein
VDWRRGESNITEVLLQTLLLTAQSQKMIGNKAIILLAVHHWQKGESSSESSMGVD